MSRSFLLDIANQNGNELDWHRLGAEGVFGNLDGAIMFNGALRIFGESTSPELPSREDWNADSGWAANFAVLASGLRSFAEDAFGNQFVTRGPRIAQFMAETGAVIDCAPDFESWFRKVLEDPDEWLSSWLVNDWVAANGRIPSTEHLCAKTPFVLGGEADGKNLYLLPRSESMSFKGSIAIQIHGLPNGSKVRLRVI